MHLPLRRIPSIILAASLLALAPVVRTEAAANAANSVPVVVEKIHAPNDLAALRAQLGRRVVLEGEVVAIGKSRSGATSYLNFTKNYRDSVSLVFLGGKANAFPKEKLDEFMGRKIHIGGILEERNGALQIRVISLEQIRLVN